MRLFIGIVSCWAHRYTHQAVRDTWLKTCDVDYKFLLGEGEGTPEADELVLPVKDTYEALTDKALATIDYVLRSGYDYMLHVGRDTYVSVPRVRHSGLDKYDYAGNCGCQGDQGFCPLEAFDEDRPFHYASGGAGSWLSRKAMNMIMESSIRHWADDLMFGWILGSKRIPLWSDNRFQKKGPWLYSPQQFTLHLGQGTDVYDPSWMYRAHELSR